MIKCDDGSKRWFNEYGLLHRTDGPAFEDKDGTKIWYQNGELHRTDGPAFEDKDGNRQWYQYGKFHRTDGPAIENANGTTVWCVRDTNITEWIKEHGISDNQSVEEQILIRLTWG